MKILKIKMGLLSLLAVLAVSVFLTSCKQEAINIPQTALEAEFQQGRFTKDIVIDSGDNSEFKLTVSTDDSHLLNLVDENLFEVEAIFELPEIAEESGDILLWDVNDAVSDIGPFLDVTSKEKELPEGAIGIRISFKSNEGISSRYNRVSARIHKDWAKKIVTSNTGHVSIKMKYYDDHNYAGYRSLCNGPCDRNAYTFSRDDKGVGYEYHYWNGANGEVNAYFLE